MASPIFMAACCSSLVADLMLSRSSVSLALRNASSADSTRAASSAPILPWASLKVFSDEYSRLSASFLASMRSLRSLSCSLYSSASRTMRSMSPSDSPPEDWITMLCCLPVALSLADTLTMPLASMSKVTSIWGTPRGAGGRSTKSNWPSILLSAAISRSPCSTLMPTCVWLSAAVENTWPFLVGMVVLRGMSRVKTPPSVSMPSDSGVTSSSRMSFTSPLSTPPWMAAPMATTSSGLTPLDGLRPKKASTASCTLGMRVMPPTSSTSLMSPLPTDASLRHLRHGSRVRSTRSSTMASNLARVTRTFMCLGPDASAVMNGRFTSVSFSPSSSRFAFSAASRSRCIASGSPLRSIPASFLNSPTRCPSSASSKSSPPRMVSPFVAFTSNSPSLISSTDTSKVPPPRSYTAIVLPSLLSSPYASDAAVGSLMMRSTFRPAMRPASFVA
mmetsp:Transcript_4003/g.12806  ORF Transcript_4003/g.12806 Transcript_4003/m.12806 type:complete len:446 (+) Transcript_4003:240-1577(+)